MKKNSKIFFITECPYSGVFRSVIEHAKLFRKMGFNNIFFILPKISRDRYGETLFENENLLQELGKILHFPLRRSYRFILGDKKNLYTFFSKQEDDYVVISYTGYAGKLCRLLYREGIIKKLYHVPQCIDFIRRPIFQRIVEYLFEKILANSVSYYLACGPSESYSLTNVFNVDSDKVILAPNFILSSHCDKIVKKEYDFIVLGRVSKDKNVDGVLAAAEAVGLSGRFIVVGAGLELEYLKKKYPKVNFLGRVSNVEAKELLKKAKYFVSNSIIEGLPYSMLEAMAYGVVPIVSNVQGHNDLIVNNFNGFMFNDQKQLSNMLFMASVFLTESKYLELSVCAKESIEKTAAYSEKNIRNHFLKKYE